MITGSHFISNLINKNYFARSYDDLNCKSANVVYELECNLCGLVYVGETNGKQSILSMRVRIIEQIYHRTNNSNIATILRRQKEDHYIRELGTATPYGCNDKIDCICIISSLTCRSVNVMDIFSTPLLGVSEAMVIVIIHPLYFMMFHEINFYHLYRSRWGCITFALNYFHFPLYNSCFENHEFKWI